MLRLERITHENLDDILALDVNEHQKDFVADNARSIIEAYIAVSHGGNAFAFGVFDGDTAVGFVMIGYGTDDEWTAPPQIAKNSYNIWRLMTDKHYQGRGLGKGALKLALDFIKTFPCGKAEQCWVSYKPDNTAAKELYRSFGFTQTGEYDGGEVIAVKKLQGEEK